MEWLLEKAAVCRLAFARVSLQDKGAGGFSSFHSQGPAVIHQTRFARTPGRPRTSQWAYWFGYMLKTELSNLGNRPTASYLGKVTSLLLNRKVISGEEVRIEFVGLRKKAIRH